MPETASGYDLVFQSSALALGDLFLRRMNGREAISNLFEFELLVDTTFGGALEASQLDEIMAGTAYLAFGADEEHKIHGVVREIEMLSMADPVPVSYRIKFVPKMFDTTLTFGSWIYQELSVPDMVKDVLKEAGFAEGDDFEFRLSGTYAVKEYTVQYAETDFDFISRQLEHEGLFYFFEHGPERAKMVIADSNNAFLPLEGHETIQYDPRGNVTDAAESISVLNHTQVMIPKTMKLRDYNYRIPSVQLISESDIDSKGTGRQFYYGEHFKDVSQGRRLARIRAQELLAQKQTYRGTGRIRGLRTGHKFTLENHLLGTLDMEYTVTEMVHSVVQSAQADVDSQSGTHRYTHDFVAIPYAVAFRPRRVTPKPKLYGIIQGKIDAGEDGDRSTPVDEFGRYKVVMPFDVDGTTGGKASRWIRMCQPASGGGYGMHFPLHVGTEVLLTHIEGDPDRPIIVGSVPNHETVSPVTRANAQQARIGTRHGITVTMDDQSG